MTSPSDVNFMHPARIAQKFRCQWQQPATFFSLLALPVTAVPFRGTLGNNLSEFRRPPTATLITGGEQLGNKTAQKPPKTDP
jgi:hypothetical protein